MFVEFLMFIIVILSSIIIYEFEIKQNNINNENQHKQSVNILSKISEINKNHREAQNNIHEAILILAKRSDTMDDDEKIKFYFLLNKIIDKK